MHFEAMKENVHAGLDQHERIHAKQDATPNDKACRTSTNHANATGRGPPLDTGIAWSGYRL